MIRFLSEIKDKYTKLAKIVKISISFNRLVFPLNFNRFLYLVPWMDKNLRTSEEKVTLGKLILHKSNETNICVEGAAFLRFL